LKEEFDENIISTLENQLKIEDEKTERAMKYMYEYKEAYGNVFFTDIPTRKLIHGYSEQQITRSNFDKSTILDEISKKSAFKESNDNLQFYQMFLGECQFAFILFYLGQNYEGFEQWKKIVYLLCHWEEAMTAQRDLFTSFIPVIYEQLDQLPNDFFDSEVPGGIYFEDNKKSKTTSIQDNFIFESLNTFYEIWMSEPIDGRKISKKIKSRAKKLQSLMIDKFGVNISTEEERLSSLISKSKDMAALSTIREQDGSLVEREEQVTTALRGQPEELDIDNDNTYDNEETQGMHKISSKDIEMFKRQMALEGDEYLPCIVDVHEKLISFD
jgi:hypothetical protein